MKSIIVSNWIIGNNLLIHELASLPPRPIPTSHSFLFVSHYWRLPWSQPFRACIFLSCFLLSYSKFEWPQLNYYLLILPFYKNQCGHLTHNRHIILMTEKGVYVFIIRAYSHATDEQQYPSLKISTLLIWAFKWKADQTMWMAFTHAHVSALICLVVPM